MARDHTQTLFSMWTDEDFCTNLLFDKLLYNVILGQPAMNWAGVQPINFKRWRKAMRDGDVMPSELDIKAAMIRLERRRYIFTDDDTGEVLARTAMRGAKVYQQPMVMLSALRAIAVVESPKLVAVLLEELGLIEVPEINGDKPSANRLRLNLKQAHADAATHCETLSKGSTEGFREPFAEDFPEGLPKGSTRPAETEPSPRGSTKGSTKPTGVGVGVEVISSPVGGWVGEGETETAETVQRQPNPDRNEPPSERCPKHTDDPDPPPCGACAGHRRHRERWDRQQADRDAERRAAFAAEIAACPDCDERGWIDGSTGLSRCPSHDWNSTATGSMTHA